MTSLLLYLLGILAVMVVVLGWMWWDQLSERCVAERRAAEAERVLVVERRRWAIHREHDRLRLRAEFDRWGVHDDGQETVDE